MSHNLFVATCDLSAHVRGRSVPATRAEETLRTGTGWVPANLAISASGHLTDNEFGSTGDLRLLPDPTTRCTIEARRDKPGVDIVLANQTELDGSPWTCCPRGFLSEVVDDLAAEGLTIRASFEHEFTLSGQPDSQPFSLDRFRRVEPFGSELVALVERAGLEPETWLPEYGPGQFELTLRPAHALAAADRAILLRELVRDLANEVGHPATFTPVVSADGIGNGVHVHLSVYDTDGTPLLYDPARPGGLSRVGGSFAAGVIRHARALCALTAASPVSYLRLAPGNWSASAPFIADRDREAMLRICPTSGTEEEVARQYNLEFRAADATANPWFALGAILRAGLHGVRAGYDPAEVALEEGDGVRARAGGLPSSLGEALDELRADDVARGWFDPLLLSTYEAVKRADLDEVAKLEVPDLCEWGTRVY
ncbi:glutamine synthetase family protein [Nocardioidaceae bacterium SCSIO 66511]|nr:glutamine synthetase family protein [Nocardioidaceae bacterium SCSIO 66511]